MVIAAINCVPAGNRQACDKHQVHGYPTTKVSRNFTNFILDRCHCLTMANEI